jgi:hypothetical protein
MVKHLLFFFSIILVSCSSQPKEVVKAAIVVDSNAIKPPETPTSQFTTQLFLIDSLNPKSGFGYNILVDGAIFIHQNSIPSIQGNKAFSSKEKAELVANLMVNKLQNNIMPPSISKEELDSLHILN